MKLNSYIYLISMLLFVSVELIGHDMPEITNELPTYVELSAHDIKFLLDNPHANIAYIPPIVSELFINLKDFTEPVDYTPALATFIQLVDQHSFVLYRETALKAIFGALSLIKKYEETLPYAYVEILCDILYGYQKSLHKEEPVYHGIDSHNKS